MDAFKRQAKDFKGSSKVGFTFTHTDVIHSCVDNTTENTLKQQLEQQI